MAAISSAAPARVAALTVAAALAVGILSVPPAAAADVDVELSYVHRGTDVEIDAAGGRIYATSVNGFVVRSLADGSHVGEVALSGAEGLGLSADGSALYAAVPGANAIVAFDTATLTEVARYDTGTGTCPRTVATAGTTVWFGYGTGWGCTAPGIGAIDLAGETPAVATALTTESFPVAPKLLPVPGATPRLLAAGVTWGDDAVLRSFTVSGTALTLAASRDLGTGFADFALVPDGSRVVTATRSEKSHHAFTVADLAPAGSFVSGARPAVSVAVAANGLVAAGFENDYDGADVRIFRPDGRWLRSYVLQFTTSRPGTLGFTADSTRLVSLSISGGGRSWLQLRDGAGKEVPTIKAVKPAAVPQVRSAFTFTGTMSAPSGVPAGSVLRVTRKSTYGTVALPAVTTGTGGAFTVTDTVRKRATYTYTLAFDGDDARDRATASVSFPVKGLVPSLSVRSDKTVYPYSASTATVTVRLGSSYNKKVKLTATPAYKPEAVLKEGTVGSTGTLTAKYTLARNTKFTAYFAGDEVYEPRTVRYRAGVRPILTSRLAGYYATSGSYRVYRVSVDPELRVVHTPASGGACAKFEAQVYRSGAWQALASESCIRFDSYSRAIGVLVGTPRTGVPYRIRARTYHGAYLAVTGAWQYFRFTA